MSITGSFGSTSLRRSEDVGEALRELQYSFPGNRPTVLAARGATFGTVNEGSLWSGHSLLVAFEGELYDRVELASKLGVDPGSSNADLAAKAFQKWEALFAAHLYGEYSFAVWEENSSTLWIGCDAMARRSLLYSECEDGFCFATEARPLLRWKGVRTGIDDEAVARFLALEPIPEQTLYRNIRQATGGRVTRLRTGETPKTFEYWFPLQQPLLQAPSWQEYAEELRAAMMTAIVRRLPARGLVAAQLSSGFDSSAVTALAAQALAQQNRSMVAYTSVPTRITDAAKIVSGRFANEWPLAAETAAMYPNVEHVAIPNDAEDWWSALDFVTENLSAPVGYLRNARWVVGILKAAREHGAVSMFDGSTGNLTSSYDGGFGLFDLRKKGSWAKLARAVHARRQSGASWKSLALTTWKPSPAQVTMIRKVRGHRTPGFFELSMMREEFYKSTGLPERKYSQHGNTVASARKDGRTWRRSLLTYAEGGAMYTLYKRGANLRREDPTGDRRLIELVLRIPDEAFAAEGKPRELYREAFRRDLPASLLAETKRGLQSSDFLHIFEPWIPELHRELDLQEASPLVQRVLDLPRMRQGLVDWEKWMGGSRAAADRFYNYTFGGAILLGRFLRKVERG